MRVRFPRSYRIRLGSVPWLLLDGLPGLGFLHMAKFGVDVTNNTARDTTTGLFNPDRNNEKTVQSLQKLGYTAREIAKATGLNLQDVQRYMNYGKPK